MDRKIEIDADSGRLTARESDVLRLLGRFGSADLSRSVDEAQR